MSRSQTHFSRILIWLEAIQKLNLNRIIDGLTAKSILSFPVGVGLKTIHDSYEKSRIVSEILHGKGEREFKIFLRIVALEEESSKYFYATKQFFSRFIIFPGYGKL